MQLCQKNREFRAPPPKCLTFLRTTLTKMIVRQNDRLALQENEIHQNDRSFCRKATVEVAKRVGYWIPGEFSKLDTFLIIFREMDRIL